MDRHMKDCVVRPKVAYTVAPTNGRQEGERTARPPFFESPPLLTGRSYAFVNESRV